MKTKYRYIRFIQVPKEGRIASVWYCRDSKSDGTIGTVSWDGGWRQYCFFPRSDTMFSSGCLADIQDFIGQLMAARR